MLVTGVGGSVVDGMLLLLLLVVLGLDVERVVCE